MLCAQAHPAQTVMNQDGLPNQVCKHHAEFYQRALAYLDIREVLERLRRDEPFKIRIEAGLKNFNF